MLEEMPRSSGQEPSSSPALGRLSAVIRRLALAAALVAALPASRAHAGPPASASTAPATLVVVADAPVSRQAIAGLGAKLPAPWRVGDDTAFRKALTASGQRTAPAVAMGNASARAALVDKAQSVAGPSGARAVLFVRVSPKKSTRVVSLLLVVSGSSTPALDTTVEVPLSDEGAELIPALAPALARIASAAEPAAPIAPAPMRAAPVPEGAPTISIGPDKPARSTLGGIDRSILVFAAGGGSGARIVRYHDGLSPALRTYDLPASPNLVLSAEVYPFARLDVPVLRGLGVYGGFQHALGVSSETTNGTSVSTTWWRAEGGLRLRQAFGEEARFVLGVHGGVVKERFAFDGDKSLVSWLPDVDYLFWRVGADGRLRAGPIAILAQIAYLPAIQGGALADRFRQTSFAALELGGGLAVPIVPIFEMRATAVYTRAFYSYHPEVGDLYVAGGALDHLVRAQLLATLLL
ncbi:Hypothetical protein A7982_04618 [Minicystis rosea]|nr:Hypothetical protein A7982_04618 [Minicystis rosea]